jgi:enoyl-CoA hydratase/carnithine racemase
MILTGDMIGADQALARGLVLKVVPTDKLLINRGMEIDLTSGMGTEARCFGNLASTNDLKEGTSAFLEKRKPNFTD